MQARVHLIGELHQESVPTARIGIASAKLDFGRGKIKVLAKTDELIARLTGIGEGSLVEVKGSLRHRQWVGGGGRQLESFEVEPESIEMIHDARRERMLG